MSKLEAKTFVTQLRPIIGDKNYSLDEKLDLIAKVLEDFHNKKVKESVKEKIGSTSYHDIYDYILSNEPFIADYDEGGYIGTDEAKLATYIAKYLKTTFID